MTQIPLSLYIHMPWCVRKCPYCDFNSHVTRQGIPEIDYIDALLKDLQQDLSWVQGRTVSSIFIGGGTPSLFSAESLRRLMTGIREYVSLAADIEITLEANPGSSEQARFSGYRQAGVNRLSIGVQSFQADKLKSLGRVHDATEAMQALEAVRKAGFDNFNLDLMFGLPGQSIQDALFDLETALYFQPPHLSWYQLTLEPETHFYKKPPILPMDDLIWEMQQAGKNLLHSQWYQHYEISAFAQANKQCRHNRNYWEFGDYLGIGAGAHSKVTDMQTQIVWRFSKYKQPKQYMNPALSFIDEKKQVSCHELKFEFMLNYLRLHEPVPQAIFSERTGLLLADFLPELKEAESKGFLMIDDEFIQLSDQGKHFLNDLLEMFIP